MGSRQIIAATATLLLLAGADRAFAQCDQSQALLALNAAVRARNFSADLDRSLDRFDAQVRMMHEHSVNSDPDVKRHTYFHFGGVSSRLDGYRLCVADQPTTAQLAGGNVDLTLGFRDFAYHYAITAFLFSVGDSVAAPDKVYPQTGKPLGTGFGQIMAGARIDLGQWLSLTTAWLADTDAIVTVTAETTGSSSVDISSNFHSNVIPGSSRLYMAAKLPRWDVGLRALFSASGTALDFIAASGDPIRLTPWKFARGLVELSYIAFEEQPVLTLQLSELFRWFYVATAFEFNGVRPRFTKLGADYRLQGALPGAKGSSFWLAGAIGASAEFSIFSSAAFAAETDRKVAVGISGEAYAELAVRPFAVRVGGLVGINRAATLERLSDAAGRPEYGMLLSLLGGW
ncbi:MAG: hypothetical protein H6707_10430 [Deltaproteobacteria bacterium]|nr:hypothetical protein [Deltaproteobacteria bacterium]